MNFFPHRHGVEHNKKHGAKEAAADDELELTITAKCRAEDGSIYSGHKVRAEADVTTMFARLSLKVVAFPVFLQYHFCTIITNQSCTILT